MNEKLTNCPQCENHCPVDALKCGRGRAFFGVEGGETREHGHERGGRGGHHQPDLDSLEGLLRFFGHQLHHGAASSEMFSALSSEEQEQLKTLLKKLANA